MTKVRNASVELLTSAKIEDSSGETFRMEQGLPKDAKKAKAVMKEFEKPLHWTTQDRKKSTLFHFGCAVHLKRQVISLEYDETTKSYCNPVRVYGRRQAGKLELSRKGTLEPYVCVPFETLKLEFVNNPNEFSVVQARVDGIHFVPWVLEQQREKRKRA